MNYHLHSYSILCGTVNKSGILKPLIFRHIFQTSRLFIRKLHIHFKKTDIYKLFSIFKNLYKKVWKSGINSKLSSKYKAF